MAGSFQRGITHPIRSGRLRRGVRVRVGIRFGLRGTGRVRERVRGVELGFELQLELGLGSVFTITTSTTCL